MLACVAEGRTHDDEQEEAHRRGTTLTCDLTKHDIAEIMAGHRRQDAEHDPTRSAHEGQETESIVPRSAQEEDAEPNAAAANVAKRMAATTALAIRLAEHSVQKEAATSRRHDTLIQYCKTKAPPTQTADDIQMDDCSGAGVGLETHNWREAYAEWRAKTYDADLNSGIVPNTKQMRILETIHERCVLEECQEDGQAGEPLLRLVHGLPGSGKSQILLWLRSYFQDVWHWVEGREFVFIAPLNSMACNIGGSTVHSWGRIAFKDRRGVRIVPQESKDEEECTSMSRKCGCLRFLFIDEVEATGAEIVGQLEHNVRFHIPRQNKFRCDRRNLPRPFGGVNTFFLGDWWQLRPTGQVAIMSNPFSQKAQESAKASETMGMFWFADPRFSLQPWDEGQRMMHLDVNERSGADRWFSRVLDACREGNLCEDDYNFLHGYPTEARIEFWYEYRHINQGAHSQPLCRYMPYCIRDHWDRWPEELQNTGECVHCWTERKRRARVLLLESHPEQAKERLTHSSFDKAVLITPYNVAVYYFAQQRALNFARSTNAASFWIQATDAPPNWFASGFSKEELLQQKKKWLRYHARKTEGILSLLLCCYDMAFRVTDSSGPEFKKYGMPTPVRRLRLRLDHLTFLSNRTVGCRHHRGSPWGSKAVWKF